MTLGVAELLFVSLATMLGALWGVVTGRRQGFGSGARGNLVTAHTAASMGRWASGTFLFVFVSFWIANIILIADCSAIAEDGGLLTGGCNRYLVARFAAFSEFQSGLGGLIGLLGVAWAASYKLRPSIEAK